MAVAPRPTPSCLPVTFGQPALATVADRHARAFMAWFLHRRERLLSPLQHVGLATAVGVVLAALLQPLMLVPLGLMLGQAAWVLARRTRVLARSKAAEPGAQQPTTVTIDDAGVHVVGPATAVHRWDELGRATIHRGFLVLEGRDRSPREIVALEHLGPQVDESALLAEVRHRIAVAG